MQCADLSGMWRPNPELGHEGTGVPSASSRVFPPGSPMCCPPKDLTPLTFNSPGSLRGPSLLSLYGTVWSLLSCR